MNKFEAIRNDTTNKLTNLRHEIMCKKAEEAALIQVLDSIDHIDRDKSIPLSTDNDKGA